jgi:hypothetical protein
MAVDVETVGEAFSAGTPRTLFEANVMLGNHSQGFPLLDMPYDVSADSQRFLINERIGPPRDESVAEPPAITVVLNWDAELAED